MEGPSLWVTDSKHLVCRSARNNFTIMKMSESNNQIPALIDSDEAADLANMFRLLGDPNRIRILYALLEADELCVHDIATLVQTTDTKVSQAMRLLRTAGVVRNRRDGRHIFYSLDDAHVTTMLEISRLHVAHE